jgi:ParB family chromosome partitioning protein
MTEKRESYMQVPIEEIIVKHRIRKDMGNLPALAESMKKLGQISPISITKTNHLVAGARRLEAAKILGWRTINAIVVDLPNETAKLEYEIEENMFRQDFSAEEIESANQKLEKLINPSFFHRIQNAIIRFFKWLFKIED